MVCKLNGIVWLNLCAQLVEAIRPMYYIMISKALLSQSVSTEPDPQLGHDHVRVQTVLYLLTLAWLFRKKAIKVD